MTMRVLLAVKNHGLWSFLALVNTIWLKPPMSLCMYCTYYVIGGKVKSVLGIPAFFWALYENRPSNFRGNFFETPFSIFLWFFFLENLTVFSTSTNWHRWKKFSEYLLIFVRDPPKNCVTMSKNCKIVV